MFARALLKLHKPSLTPGKRPGRAFWLRSVQPSPEEAFCGRILLRRGRNFLERPCLPQSLSIFASPPLLEQGASRFLDEAHIHRGSNPPPRGCFCLGSCRAFKGQSKKRTLRSSLGAGPICWPATSSDVAFWSFDVGSSYHWDAEVPKCRTELGLDPPFKTLFPYKFVFPGQSLSNLLRLSPCSRL